MFNGLFINPAYAGSMEVLDVMAIYRAQWVGLEGAPNTANISINSPFRQEQYAMGLVLSDDRLGLSNTFNVTPSFSLLRLRLAFEGFVSVFRLYFASSYYQQNTKSPGNNSIPRRSIIRG